MTHAQKHKSFNRETGGPSIFRSFRLPFGQSGVKTNPFWCLNRTLIT
ncbi:unnamed protein product [Larinioides sclopetarius]|uniref:Uncharacterized protein n=1 Tax=Larinioides sclopetarius TaxID=280406 RepID=A0AAV1ZHB8_9ARAC